jgi:hypothetical protein
VVTLVAAGGAAALLPGLIDRNQRGRTKRGGPCGLGIDGGSVGRDAFNVYDAKVHFWDRDQSARPACRRLDEVVRETEFRELAFTAAHAEALHALPWHHRDPFDRMLVVQAIAEGLHLATSGTRLRNYPVACV